LKSLNEKLEIAMIIGEKYISMLKANNTMSEVDRGLVYRAKGSKK
jgi:hypothetical protein